MKEIIPQKVQIVYNRIETSRKKYGTLKKCEFHLHTPASNDYTLCENLTDADYKKLTNDEMISIAVREGLLTEENADRMLENIKDFSGEEYIRKLNEQEKPYQSLKEYLSYKLIIHKLIKEKIEVVVVSDHNTTKGYIKLKYALSEYYAERRDKIEKPLDLLLGVEISCSELNHVIVIFNEAKIDILNKFLDEILINEEGTYLSSNDVILQATELGGISYLAHIDTSNLHGNEVYNQTLFGSKALNILGFRNLEKKDYLLKCKIKNFCNDAKKKFCCITEGDAHNLDSIGVRNIWIKFSKVDFSSLKKAFNDHNICVYSEKPERSDKFIKGIVVEPGKYGFLRVNPEKIPDRIERDKHDFVLSFSRDLNCIIGGRGTGKSTILNLIETAFTLDASDMDKVNFMSLNNAIFIVFHCEGTDFVLHLIPQIKCVYEDDEDVEFLPNAIDGDELTPNWVTLYKFTDKGFGEKFEIVSETESKKILFDKIYRRGYSINSLVSKIGAGKIGAFIRDTVMFGVDYSKMRKYYEEINNLYSKGNYKSFLKKNLRGMIETHHIQSEEVNKRLESYNAANEGILKVVYSPKVRSIEDSFESLLKAIRTMKERYVAKTLMTWEEVELYIRTASSSVGILEFFDYLSNRNYKKIEEYVKLTDCIENNKQKTFSQVDIGLEEVTEKNKKSVYEAIYATIFHYKFEILRGIEKWFELADDFTILFNVNNKEAVHPTPMVFKKINELSLGQKVVAILTFVFTYGEHVNDNTPLIIDQPEDNLDNQYIFKNLVESLRLIKNKRQVIVVTHSSTIVTNADAEQVLVMESDKSTRLDSCQWVS